MRVLRRHARSWWRLDRQVRSRALRGITSPGTANRPTHSVAVTEHSPAHELQFFKSFLARPWKIASPIPAGRKLATKIAEQIDREPGGFVLELGPGTGAVTRAICERVAEQDVIAIESDAGFVALLRTR